MKMADKMVSKIDFCMAYYTNNSLVCHFFSIRSGIRPDPLRHLALLVAPI